MDILLLITIVTHGRAEKKRKKRESLILVEGWDHLQSSSSRHRLHNLNSNYCVSESKLESSEGTRTQYILSYFELS